MCLVTLSTPAEAHNVIYKRARVVVERTFGQVKRGFYCVGSSPH